MPVVNLTRGTWLATTVRRADTFVTRLVGWMVRTRHSTDQALWMLPCRAVHTLGMRVPIDVVFIDRGSRVVAMAPSLRPNRMTAFHLGAHSAVELPEGSLRKSKTLVGDELEISRDESCSIDQLVGDHGH